jgi:hypothetical protein
MAGRQGWNAQSKICEVRPHQPGSVSVKQRCPPWDGGQHSRHPGTPLSAPRVPYEAACASLASSSSAFWSAFSSLASTFLARFMAASTLDCMSETATTTRPA